MRIILNDCEDPIRAAKIAKGFDTDYPAPHKQCLYVDDNGLHTYVHRIKTGLSVRQWREKQCSKK